MEELPVEYTEHNLPLVFLSGLLDEDDQHTSTSSRPRQETGTRISSERAPCSIDRAKSVLQQFLAWDGTQLPWNAVALPGPPGSMKYRFRSVGRNYTLPPRKAAPLAQSPTSETVPLRQVSNELHSPLSPLSPGSPVFPDGIMTPLWFAKHQLQVPCLIVVFFDFSHDGGSKEDDQTKADINAVKTSLARSGFRARLAAVLMSDRSIVQAPEMDERFTAIRRATSLDSKTGLFFMPPMPSDGEIATFVQSTLTTLQPVCVEYYRELTKHARRKKSRSSVPLSPTIPLRGASQSLSTPGWNARYEIKQALFAEYRQEMDVAERHYSQAIEDLCSTDGVFEGMPNWSPRWDEARLLCDAVAARVIRCHLWSGLTTTATQAWVEHRNRMKSLLDRKGKGTHTYGWLAWQARWARIMAQLIQLAEPSMLENSTKARNEPPVDLNEFHAYARPDRVFASFESIPPFHLLHHPGYWHRLAIKYARARHTSALAIQDEDRIPPGQSPASSVANRAQAYDTYLVPEPHEEYASAETNGKVGHVQLMHLTEQANQEFLNKGQRRMAEQLDLELAEDLMGEDLSAAAMQILVPLWDAASWREERWHPLFERLLVLLSRCAIALKNAEIALATVWEQQSVCHPAQDEQCEGIQQTLTKLDVPDNTKVVLEFSNAERISPVRLSFAFDEVAAYAGEPVTCQLCLTSNAPPDTQPIDLAEIKVSIAGLQNVYLKNQGNDQSRIHEVDLVASDTGLTGLANMSLAAGQTRIYNFAVTFREAGSIAVTALAIRIEGDSFRILHTVDETQLMQSADWHAVHDNHLISQETRAEDTTSIEVLPKPPKVDIQISSLRDQYIVGESLALKVAVTNGEAQSVSGNFTHKVTSQIDELQVISRLYKADTEVEASAIDSFNTARVLELELHIEPVQLSTKLAINISFSYELADGSHTGLVKQLDVLVPLTPLLNARWSFGPLLHSQPWPSYFDASLEESTERPSGIPQQWRTVLTAQNMHADVVVHRSSIQLSQNLIDAVCNITNPEHEPESVMRSGELARRFELLSRKASFDDRRPIHLNLRCSIVWSHKEDNTKHTSLISVPRITLPSSEPRVLCTSARNSSGSGIVLQYYLENLSTHFLTFAITMEANEEFAFSGAKYRTLSLAPLSRLCVPYDVVLHNSIGADVDGVWIWPNLQVKDSYYQKTLRIQPAGEDVELDATNRLGIFVRKSV